MTQSQSSMTTSMTPGSAVEKSKASQVKSSAVKSTTIKKKLEKQLDPHAAVSRNENPKATSSNGTGGSLGSHASQGLLKKN